MRIIFFFILFFSRTIFSSELSEVSINDGFREQSSHRFLIKSGVENREYENYIEEDPIIFTSRLISTSLFYEHRISEKYIIQFSGKYSKFDDDIRKSFYHDPSISLWKRTKFDTGEFIVFSDLGLMASPVLSENNIFKDKNGHDVALKYKIGIEKGKESYLVSYLLGYKDSISFFQDGQRRNYKSMMYFGADLRAIYKFLDSFLISANVYGHKRSQNSAEPFFQDSQSVPAWETGGGVFLQYQFSNNLKIGVDYQVMNESDGLNKSGADNDIEFENSIYSVSLSYNF